MSLINISFADNGATTQTFVICYSPSLITSNGFFQGDNPLDFALPLFILQLATIVLMIRVFVYLLKPFRQPRVIAEIFGGVILGPSVLGRIEEFSDRLFPIRSIMVLETMANIGLLYYLFLVGLEMDLSIIRRTGKKSLVVAVAGMALPFLVAAAASSKLMPPHMHHKGREEMLDKTIFILFFGVAISVTAFPVLARILAELKLLGTDLGKIAMSSAIVNDMLAWILLGMGIALAECRNVAEHGKEHKNTDIPLYWVVILSTAFVGFCIFVLRPGIGWLIRRTPEGEAVSDFHTCLILTGVMLCGFITDSIGTHSIFGAFMFGLVIPNGPLGSNMIEKLEDFVSGLLLPLFFAISGLRTNVSSMTYSADWIWTLIILILCSLAKIGATFLTAVFYEMPTRDGFALGLLMNTKGLIEMIVLNVGRDQKRRTIQKSKPDAELRLLACIHNPRNVPTAISLLDISHPNKKSPIYVYALQLVELTGRASAMLIVHNTRKSGRPAVNRTQAQSDQIVTAFEIYEQHAAFVSVQPLTAISPYSTMHEDICNLAEEKRVSMIVVPFHKQQTIDGEMEAPNPAFRTVNQNVLANAPCSVGILVDRGLGASARTTNPHGAHHIVVIFFSGPDDREALAYALRMSDSPHVSLTVLRFIPGDDAKGWFKRHENDSSADSGTLGVVTDKEKERQMDEDSISDFILRTRDNDSVVYTESVTNNGEETVSTIRSMDNIHDLYIVGRGQGMITPLTAGLTDWSECPELGAIGDLLASADFSLAVSVLVVQQYVGMGIQGDGVATPDSPAQQQPDQQFDQLIKVTSSGIHQGDNPLNFALPLFILQLVLVVFVTRLFIVLLKPFRQPRIIADILGGIVLGPSGIGGILWAGTRLYPIRSIMVLETMANVGLLYYLFLVGLEMDLSVVKRTGKKSLVVALAGMGLPFLIAGASSYKILHGSGRHMTKDDYLRTGTFILFFGAALSVTAFTVLARVLAELKLLTTELVYVVLVSVVFVGLCIYVIRPGIEWIIRRTPEGESAKKLEDLVSGLLLPLFFTVSGLRINFRSITYSSQSAWLLLFIIVCSLAKIGATFLASLYFEMPTSEAIALGLLMNIKGLNEIIVLNLVYSPGGRFVPNKRRTIQKSKPDAELRLLACIHNPRNVPTITRLLDITYQRKRSPIYVFVLQLTELTGRASAMHIVHNTRKSGRPAMNRTQARSNQIVNAFENYEQNAEFVAVQPLTAMSPYSTMHEDICNLAEVKRVSIVILPFHKQQTIDGGMEEPNPAFRTINQNVLANAPCSVGILVDRGLGASARATNSNGGNNISVLFFGGPDDREGLAYALRMSGNPSVSLTVHRFIPGEEARGWSRRHDGDSTDNDMLSVVTDNERERQLDEDSISDFRMKTSNNESVVYKEIVTNNGEETVSAIRSMDHVHDLYIVGRGQGTPSPLTDGLTDWSECPELGAIGDILASADFALSVSVLVVQQYVGMGLQGDGVSSTDSPAALQPDQKF
ncbi:hypothetical protein C5167_047582 [Papaver somniferum]|uniref:Cation/H+ exchanger domain-containing protein n=1 Tax=Papaver somniferum TaxID=3469 RepID=A0A4Y7LH39_PAPSO|nr:hypothetical protein C5167_047582 [Papaver somniferum]